MQLPTPEASLPGLSMQSDVIYKGSVDIPQANKYSNVPLSYDAIAARRHSKGRPSSLPSSAETEALLSLEKRDLFTEDAWQGMLRYAHAPRRILSQVGRSCKPQAPAMLTCHCYSAFAHNDLPLQTASLQMWQFSPREGQCLMNYSLGLLWCTDGSE